MSVLINFKTQALGLCIISSFLFTSCNTRKFKVWIGPEKQQKVFNLKYGDHKKQKMDVFLPSIYPNNSSIVILVHGGAWKYGKKEELINIQKLLYKNNIPSININYRLVDKNITYKNQLEDIALAIEKFNDLAEKAELTANNYIILGESSGGHLALLYGYQHPNQIKKIISLSGPTDFYSKTFLNSTYSKYSSPTLQKVVGTKFDRKNLSEEFKKASPIANVNNVPTLIFQGSKDFIVNKKQGISLDSVLTAHKIPHRFILMENSGHLPRKFNKKKRDSLIYPAILEWVKK